jgi:hypothetical protein
MIVLLYLTKNGIFKFGGRAYSYELQYVTLTEWVMI